MLRQARLWCAGGWVQGVSFRPLVYRLVQEHGLTSWVQNRLDEVSIHSEGDPAAQGRSGQALIASAPPWRSHGS